MDHEIIERYIGQPARLPRELRARIEREWGDRLIRSWDEKWMSMSASVGDLIGAGLLGARPGEVVVADSTTVNMYKLLWAGLNLEAKDMPANVGGQFYPL